MVSLHSEPVSSETGSLSHTGRYALVRPHWLIAASIKRLPEPYVGAFLWIYQKTNWKIRLIKKDNFEPITALTLRKHIFVLFCEWDRGSLGGGRMSKGHARYQWCTSSKSWDPEDGRFYRLFGKTHFKSKSLQCRRSLTTMTTLWLQGHTRALVCFIKYGRKVCVDYSGSLNTWSKNNREKSIQRFGIKTLWTFAIIA